MAQKHELMAKLQAARQTSGKLVEAESRKAYPQEIENRQLEIPHIMETPVATDPPVFPVNKEEAPKEVNAPEESPAEVRLKMETEGEVKREAEKITYTTISVPKQYGQKAKLYATLLKVNMVEFTCGALDAYILQLQEANKLPKVDL